MGHLDALTALGRSLGYDVDRGWTHPDGRRLVSLGDLVDYGPAALEVADLVRQLTEDGRACALLGNHEYNLLEAWRGASWGHLVPGFTPSAAADTTDCDV